MSPKKLWENESRLLCKLLYRPATKYNRSSLGWILTTFPNIRLPYQKIIRREQLTMIQMCHLPSTKNLLSACLLLLWIIPRADGENINVDTAVRDRFLQEAPVLWEQYEARLRYLQGNLQARQTLKGTGIAAEIKSSLLWKANETSRLVIKSAEREANSKTTIRPIKVICSNSRYGFILERRTKESPWLLIEIVQDKLADFNKRHFHKEYPEPSAFPITFSGVRLKDIIKREEFQITGCQTVAVDGEALVEVAFDFDNKGIEETFPFQGGKIVLDPQRFWCLRTYEVRMNHPAFRGTKVFKVLERAETAGAFPWPKHVVIDSHFSYYKDTKKKNDYKKDEDFIFDLNIQAKLPSEDEFTLTAFGFPEPPGVEWKKPFPWYLVVAIFGTVCLGIFFFLRVRYRRLGWGD